jgi:hypothetical protein
MKVYNFSIIKADLTASIEQIAEKLREAGSRGYCVVGCVESRGTIIWTLQQETEK